MQQRERKSGGGGRERARAPPTYSSLLGSEFFGWIRMSRRFPSEQSSVPSCCQPRAQASLSTHTQHNSHTAAVSTSYHIDSANVASVPDREACTSVPNEHIKAWASNWMDESGLERKPETSDELTMEGWKKSRRMNGLTNELRNE